MMLQGHFTDTLLAPAYRDLSNPIFATWSFMRGMTAPIFFFASGLIFVFLLLRKNKPFWENERVQKGAKRGFQLILIGYVLRLSFPRLLTGQLYEWLWYVDVLHCIGIALWSLVIAYFISHATRVKMPLVLAIGAFLAFFYYFDFQETDWSLLPVPIANYLTKANGSVFTPIPWVAYAMLGGILGYYLNRFPKLAFGQWLPVGLLITGLLTHFFSFLWLDSLYHWTGIEQFYRHANYNFLLWRLGHVFVAVALFIWIAQLWKNIPPLLLKMGSETLVIYEVHYVLLYSTWFGIGLSRFWSKSLTAWETLAGALLFELFFFILIAHIGRIRAVKDRLSEAWIKPRLAYSWKYIRIMTRRRYGQWAKAPVKLALAAVKTNQLRPIDKKTNL
jgi:hypothetical protein